MALALKGATSGSVTLDVPAVAGSSLITVPAVTGTLITTADADTVTPAMLSQPLTRMTAQNSTSGTSIDFTGIPSWARRITVLFNGVSTNGISLVRVQIGGGSVETSGYVAGCSQVGTGAVAATSTAGFDFHHGAPSAADVKSGQFTVYNVSGNQWVASYVITNTNNGYHQIGGGTKTTAAALDRVRVTTVNGTDTFDSGSVNVLYEG